MDADKKLHTIILALLIEHLASYFIAYFRQYDIERYGELDIQGVPQAKRESAIANIQYLFVCLIVGFSVKQMFILDPQERRFQSYLVQWIIVDCIIILIQRYYIYVCQMMMISGEIMKNVYTLQFTQNKILQELKMKKELEIQNSLGNRLSELIRGVKTTNMKGAVPNETKDDKAGTQ